MHTHHNVYIKIDMIDQTAKTCIKGSEMFRVCTLWAYRAWCLNKFLVPARSPTRHLDPLRTLSPIAASLGPSPDTLEGDFGDPTQGTRGCSLSQKSVIWLTLRNSLDTTPSSTLE
jgi:hypothetical protein